ncbi:hypothetical protein VTG60DRAFT_50 [Thermothelomyces hinnuleus]
MLCTDRETDHTQPHKHQADVVIRGASSSREIGYRASCKAGARVDVQFVKDDSNIRFGRGREVAAPTLINQREQKREEVGGRRKEDGKCRFAPQSRTPTVAKGATANCRNGRFKKRGMAGGELPRPEDKGGEEVGRNECKKEREQEVSSRKPWGLVSPLKT